MSELALDPVCGMKVDPARAAATVEHGGKRFYFCAKSCAEKFQRDPAHYLADGPYTAAHAATSELVQLGSKPAILQIGVAPAAAQPAARQKTGIYTCPMHPEVRQVGPGACPLCGMALEPMDVTATSDDSQQRQM